MRAATYEGRVEMVGEHWGAFLLRRVDGVLGVKEVARRGGFPKQAAAWACIDAARQEQAAVDALKGAGHGTERAGVDE